MKTIFRLIPVIFCTVLLCGCFSKATNDDNSDKMVSLVNDFLAVRYEKMNADNFVERIEKQEEYFTKRLIDNYCWMNHPDNVKESAAYISAFEYEAKIMLCDCKVVNRNMVESRLFVLYDSEHDEYDNIVEYIFDFVLEDKGNGQFLIDNIIPIRNNTSYVLDGEIVHDGETIYIKYPDEEEHHH